MQLPTTSQWWSNRSCSSPSCSGRLICEPLCKPSLTVILWFAQSMAAFVMEDLVRLQQPASAAWYANAVHTQQSDFQVTNCNSGLLGHHTVRERQKHTTKWADQQENVQANSGESQKGQPSCLPCSSHTHCNGGREVAAKCCMCCSTSRSQVLSCASTAPARRLDKPLSSLLPLFEKDWGTSRHV